VPSLVNGLGGAAGFGEFSIAPNDDGSSASINISSVFADGLNFFGTTYTSLFVNNNGNLTFVNSLSQYIAAPIGGGGLSVPIIAAYWFDVDTRGGVDNPTAGGTSTGSNLVYYDLDTTNHIFTATWDDTGYYSSHIGAPNAFQIRLIDVGGGDFDIEFIYESINQSHSDTNSDPGEAPRAGYARGNGTAGVELAGSGDYNAVLDYDTDPGNTGVPGYYYFQVRGGQVTGGDGGSAGPPTPPRPVTFTIDGPGLVHEGDSGATAFDFVVHRAGTDLSAASVVDWSIQLDDPNDLVPGQPLQGQFVLAPYETTATVHVEVQGDHLHEQDDMVLFHLDHVTFADESWDPDLTAAGSILNDDPQTVFAFAGPQLRPEGQVGTTAMEFIVVRDGDLHTGATVQWRLDEGTADHLDLAPDQATSGVITFEPNAAQAVIQVMVQGDVRPEPDETFTVRLTSATIGNTAPVVLDAATTGTILDDDMRPSLLVASPSALVLPEGGVNGATAFGFTVMRVGDVSEALTVPYAVSLPSDGLSSGEVQSPLDGVISFAAGATQATITVLVSGDAIPEDNESFQVIVGGGALNSLVLTGVALNDDKVPASFAPATDVPAAAPDSDISSFMQQLAGGGLWSDAAVL
jgi:hypothetical protein